MDANISEILQTFAPGILIQEEHVPTLDDNIIIKNCVYSNDKTKLNVIFFTVRTNKSNGYIEFKIGSTNYIASGVQDRHKICDFILHMEILAEELELKYKQITKFLNARPDHNSLMSYTLLSLDDPRVYATIQIKNGKIIFWYKNTTKYKYDDIHKLLTNPLVQQFKIPYRWFWL